MSLEDSFSNYAVSTGQDSVILCDRGVMDGKAYVPVETWRSVLQVFKNDRQLSFFIISYLLFMIQFIFFVDRCHHFYYYLYHPPLLIF